MEIIEQPDLPQTQVGKTIDMSVDFISIYKKNNFKCFCKYYLHHKFPLSFAKGIHDDFSEVIEKARYNSLYEGFLAPRDTAKSTFLCEAAPIYWICHNRQEKIFITQKTSDVKHVIQSVMFELENNKELIQDFGIFKPKNRNLQWSYAEGGTVEGAIDKKNPTITGAGVETGSIGYRLTKAIIDDIWDPTNVNTLAQRDKVIKWVMTAIIPALTQDGSAFFTNSTYHEDDMLNRFLAMKIKELSWIDDKGHMRTMSFRIRRYDSIISEEKQEVIWPEKNTYGRLMFTKSLIGPVIFDQQYRNITMSEETAPFSNTLLRSMRNEDISYLNAIKNREDYLSIIQSWDLAVEDDMRKAKEKDSDYYVCTTLGITQDKKRRVLNLARFRGLRPDEVILKIEELYLAFKPDLVIMESNQAQRWIASYVMRLKNIPIYKNFTVGKDRAGLKMKSSVLHIALYAKYWEFPFKDEDDQRITEEIWHELFYFGKERHDDIVMSMYFTEKVMGDIQQILVDAQQMQGEIHSVDILEEEVLNDEDDGVQLS